MRVAGTVRTVSRYAVGTRHASVMGVIERQAGGYVVYDQSECLPDGSRPVADRPCTFIEDDGYARAISTIDLTTG